ncbi:MAG: SPFH domain-containing protein [Betaproteobacteria bacterium]|nr:SPFH domain-containing protein [Betaproteobacteria bacterium]
MLGIRFIKTQPTTYVLQYKGGKVVREGTGLSFFYYGPTSTLVAIPVGSKDEGYIFEQVTADFQTVTVQGQVAWRVSEPRKLAAMLNYALTAGGASYASDDPEKLSPRIVKVIEVLSKQAVKDLGLKDALRAADTVAASVMAALRRHPEIGSLGLEILGVSVIAIKPTPETSRALEAEAREAILKAADDAVFLRRNAAVENERAIRESELDTDIAVEQKKRAIRETQMEAEASVQRKQHELRHAAMEADVSLEETRKAFVTRNAENTRTLAEAESHRLVAVMKALHDADPKIVQALASAGMQPNQLIAQAFGGIAEKAEKIGQLNMSPDLLQALLTATTTPPLALARKGG